MCIYFSNATLCSFLLFACYSQHISIYLHMQSITATVTTTTSSNLDKVAIYSLRVCFNKIPNIYVYTPMNVVLSFNNKIKTHKPIKYTW